MIISFLIARNFLSDVNDTLSKKFNDADVDTPSNNVKDIPSAIECPKCGTFYAEMPKGHKCSCGSAL